MYYTENDFNEFDEYLDGLEQYNLGLPVGEVQRHAAVDRRQGLLYQSVCLRDNIVKFLRRGKRLRAQRHLLDVLIFSHVDDNRCLETILTFLSKVCWFHPI